MELDALSIHLELPDLWQQQAVRALKAGRDAVIDAPTGAGKTYVFELLVKSGDLGGQAVFTVPTRALANDKWREWSEAGWDVGIATGDLAVNVDAPVVVATLETQRERLLRHDGPKLLVIDEYQMIGDRRRGLNYELAVALSPPDTQLLLLSGSVANPHEIADWMRRLNRDVDFVQTRVRPVPLDDIPLQALPYQAPNSVKNFWQRLAVQVLMADYAPLLIFAPQRRAAEKIAQKISEGLPLGKPVPLTQQQESALGPKLTKLIRNRVAYHHSGLSYAQRAGVIEPLAKAGHLRVIVATTGLAAGINFSVRSVYVAETQYFEGPFQREIEPDELLQMMGRAGRRGLDERGYVISAGSSPRLSDTRPKHLRRNNEIDWPTLLRVMKAAKDRGESPFDAASDLCGRLFSRQTIKLGFEDTDTESETAAAAAKDSDRGLFGLGPVRREVRNSERDWEREDPQATDQVPLKDALYFTNPKQGWQPALESNAFMQQRVVPLGRVCKIRNGDRPAIYGAEVAVANVVEGDRFVMTKRLRSLTQTPKKQAERTEAELAALIEPVVREQEPGATLSRLEKRRDSVVALIDFAEVPVSAYRDSKGAWLINPKRRTVNVQFDTSYLDETTGAVRQPPLNSAAYAWRKLGLIESDGTPTQRGQIFSFFQYGEGLPIAAALEDETYPVEDILMHLANVRAGHRFESEAVIDGGSERLAAVCRQTYGPVDYEGYLRLGLPTSYGEGAAEVVEARLSGASRRIRGDERELGEGDVERAMLEWFSLLRHIRHAPELDFSRWQQLQQAAVELLRLHGRLNGTPPNVPKIEPYLLHQTVNHRLSLRDANRVPS